MILPRAKATGNWTDDLIKPWGKMVKQALKKYNDNSIVYRKYFREPAEATCVFLW